MLAGTKFSGLCNFLLQIIMLKAGVMPSQIQQTFKAAYRGAFFQFLFRWIYYYDSNKSTGKKTGKMHLCALQCTKSLFFSSFVHENMKKSPLLSRILNVFFCTGLAAQMALLLQKKEFYRLSETPLLILLALRN